MRRMTVALVVTLLILAPVGVSYAQEEGTAIATDAEEKAVAAELASPLDDWYGQLNLRSGAMWIPDAEKWTAYATVPVLGYKQFDLEAGVEIPPEEVKEGPTAWVVGLTYNLGDLEKFGVDVSWAKHFGVNVGPVLRYEYGTGKTQLAFVVSVVDLAFNDGDADRKRGR